MKRYFDFVHEDVETFRKDVLDAIKRAEKARAELNAQDLSMFKDSHVKKLKKDNLQQIDANLRTAVDLARKMLAESVHDSVRRIKAAYMEKSTAITPEGYAAIDKLRLYRDFDLKMSKAEAQALADDLAGSTLGLRILASVAERSDLKVELPDTDQFDKILDRFALACTQATMTEFIRPDFNRAIAGTTPVEAEKAIEYWGLKTLDDKPENSYGMRTTAENTTVTGAALAAQMAAGFNADYAAFRRLGDTLGKAGVVITEAEKDAEKKNEDNTVHREAQNRAHSELEIAEDSAKQASRIASDIGKETASRAKNAEAVRAAYRKA